MDSLRDIVAQLSQQFVTYEAQDALRESLRDKNIVAAEIHLGGAAESASTKVSDQVRNAPAAHFGSSDVSDSLENAGKRVRDVYLHRRKRADVVLWSSLIA